MIQKNPDRIQNIECDRDCETSAKIWSFLDLGSRT